ncbi:toprim domain-containing protein [Morganella psychrotolerans]|uniref:DNA primase n=1 Tax=Morganella psychrotolerans TaxID=368603 RepID=A0A1B8HUL6_9GAMM|nr:toprim domain-containing protein [Morganella psychrotolerans]OBU13332.1 DNA primase [Morganella psychrotolerans]
MKTTDAARGRWAEIFEFYGLPPITGGKHYRGECPLCGDKGTFRIDDKDGNGTFICKCANGSGFKLLELTQGKSFAILAAEVDKFLGNTSRQEYSRPVRSDVSAERERFIRCYSAMPGLKDTTAAQYLQGRGIFTLPADWARFCADQPVKGRNKIYQAIWSLATDAGGLPCYLHRTYLDGAGKADKAEVNPVKKMDSLQEKSYLLYAKSVAIRMFPVDSTLGIAEGIETALSCKQVYGINTWAAMNATFMEKFIAPRGVKTLVIFADYDKRSATGHKAALDCANSNLLSNNDVEKVRVLWCDNGDFNDLILEGSEVRELPFYREKHRETA